MTIKDWHSDDRPREKLLRLGPQHLTDAEILAIFLRTGTKQQSAVELAHSLLEHFGSLGKLLSSSPDELLSCHGVGMAKYAQIMASLEMGKRFIASQVTDRCDFGRSQAIKDYLTAQLKTEDREVFAVMCLTDQLDLIDYSVLFTGGIASCSVCLRHVLRYAITHAASALVIAHNHPTQSATPSVADTKLTTDLQQAANLIGFELVDHIIVGQDTTLSFAENNWL